MQDLGYREKDYKKIDYNQNPKPKILLIGGGGHCKSVIDVIELEGKFEIAGIIEKDKSFIGKKVLDYEIIGCDNDLNKLVKKYNYAFITIGQIKNSAPRVKTFEYLKKIGFELPTIISPRAYVSKYASVNEGTIIMHYAMVNAGVKVGKNCIINTMALIEHDVVIEDHCHISTGAIINGNVVVKKESFIGSNSVVKEGIEIIESSFIKAGSVSK